MLYQDTGRPTMLRNIPFSVDLPVLRTIMYSIFLNPGYTRTSLLYFSMVIEFEASGISDVTSPVRPLPAPEPPPPPLLGGAGMVIFLAARTMNDAETLISGCELSYFTVALRM